MHSVINITRVFALGALPLIIAGCGLTSEEILNSSTQALCKTVTSPTDVDFASKEILAELENRKSAQCATQSILETNLAEYRKAQETERDQGGDGGGY